MGTHPENEKNRIVTDAKTDADYRNRNRLEICDMKNDGWGITKADGDEN